MGSSNIQVAPIVVYTRVVYIDVTAVVLDIYVVHRYMLKSYNVIS